LGTLNPKLLTPELDREMHAAGRIMRGYRKRVLTPEMLLLALVRRPGSAANQLLARLADQRGLKELEATVETMARLRGGRDVNLTFLDQDGKQISLSSSTLPRHTMRSRPTLTTCWQRWQIME
jgi:hypothetical protein